MQHHTEKEIKDVPEGIVKTVRLIPQERSWSTVSGSGERCADHGGSHGRANREHARSPAA